MADEASLKLLVNHEAFLATIESRIHLNFDFSGNDSEFDFSNVTLNAANFDGCTLRGSNFSNCVILHCNFNNTDWAGANFSGAQFTNTQARNVKNAHKALGLNSIKDNSTVTFFDTAIRPWHNKLFDWKRIGIIGKLPLFSASTTTLIILPVYFYLLDIYNTHIFAINYFLEARLGSLPALDRIEPLPIPSHSLEVFISAILLLIASVLYFFLSITNKDFQSRGGLSR
jgi:hypothetical protein